MSAVPSEFRALVAEKDGEHVAVSLRTWSPDQLMAGEVTIQVAYSSVNYKDGLAVRADGKVARTYPLVPGIDLSGTVIESQDPAFAPGQRVIAHGYDIGVAHHGGFAEVARVRSGWVVPLPAGMTMRDAMAIGTAGFTAAVSVARLLTSGARPDLGPVVVTGASGGVGSVAVDLLSARGFEVVASTGDETAHDYLRSLGAKSLISREQTSAASDKPLERPVWSAAVDTVGGSTLAYLLRTMTYGGSVTVCGNVGGAEVATSVFPFILRGVHLLGIDSVQVPMSQRSAIWDRLSTDLRPAHLDAITREVRLDDVPDVLGKIGSGATRGRTVVRIAG